MNNSKVIIINIVSLCFFILCIWLVIKGQQTVGIQGIYVMLIGLVGLIGLLYSYNKRYK